MEAEGRSEQLCRVDGTGRRPVAGRRRSLPGRASEPARAREPIVNFSVQVCLVSKNYSEPSHAPSPPRCILRSCVIRPHAHHCLGHLRAKRLCRTCSRCPPRCGAHASGLLLTPPRATRCHCAAAQPMLCPPPRHRGRDDDQTNSLLAQRAPPASASSIFLGIPPF